MSLRTIRRAASAATALAAAALIVAGCSSSESSSPTGHSGHGTTATSSPHNAAHNQADVMFNQMMIPHHEQAVEMADLVPSRTDNAQLRALATQIRNAQQPEIDQMTARLKSWGVAVDDGGDHGGHSMSGDMGGMMSDAQMTSLENARGAQFDTLWLQGMIAHHQGAITMADAELAGGIDPESRSLATQIKNTQQAEIDQMNVMLGR
ncbi:protein of unknown function DUF305 [Gordonia polyisoprenivorans VH2]|uniref:DUF305 domain-containing protein n=2 Tax=Gordonia polyisoprenivorans TaxID=84595 RepID=H6MVY7_GORPV|nr:MULTISPECIES: DUF305 domain-containing protein [Gordonia]AFA71682.1 protein of unknown function DUF305 [Gordonia polyisoprenivorans VH2]MDF3285182.1 DUF305 domain-containing protein [Gordonia sp. N1V]UZF56979.1 DUF305 domain-containing protein [Gordonia polyisoprenivorans]